MNMNVKEIYVSINGNDQWDGSKEKPYNTIEHARDEVRKIIALNRRQDIVVYLMGGEYYLQETLTFNSQDSVDDGFCTIYRNYNHEEVVINGGEKVSNWEYYEDGIYRANVGKDWQFNILYENGKFCTVSRHPKDGYNRVKSIVENSPQDQFGFEEGDVPQIEDKSSLQTYIWPGGLSGEWNWFTNTIGISEIDYSNQIIKMNNKACYELGAGSRYYIKNALELISCKGEYYLDKGNGILYYKPFNLPIEEQNIVAPKMITLISFIGEEQNVVKNVCFEGIILRNTDTASEIITVLTTDMVPQHGGIYMENSENIGIRKCQIHNMGFHALYLKGYNQKHTVYGNYIYDIGHTGIQIEGYYYSTKHVSRKNVIHNNIIFNMGKLVGHGSGIQMIQSGENHIAYNKISRTPRYAISFKLWNVSLFVNEIKQIEGIDITWENARQFSYTRDNIIEYNDLSQANYDSQDTGVIESWGAGTGNIIRNNRIHDSSYKFSYGFGIYLDDESDGFIVENNIIHDLQKDGDGELGSVILSKGVGNIFRNNYVANNKLTGAYIGTFAMGGGLNKDLISERNIFYGECGDFYGFANWQEDRFSKSDYNLIFNKNGVYNMDGVPGVSNYNEWKNMLDFKYDQHSLISNPLFCDEANLDYRLRYDSPAYSLGINDIDFENMGLLEDFSFKRNEDDSIYQVFVKSDIHEISPTLCLNTENLKQSKLIVTARTMAGFLIKDLSEFSVNFTSSNPEIVSVNNNGEVLAKASGIAKIFISVIDKENKEKTTFVHVLVNDEIHSAKVFVSKNILKTGFCINLEVYATTNFNRTIKLTKYANFTSSDESIMHIDENGKLTAIKSGTAEIETELMEFPNLEVVPVQIVVKDVVLDKIDISHNSKILKVREKANYTVIGTMSNGESFEIPNEYISILSSNEIISVSTRGEVKAEKVGIECLSFDVNYDGICMQTSMFTRVIEDIGMLTDLDVINFGEAHGKVTQAGEKLIIASSGSNIWFKEDDFTFVFTKIDRDLYKRNFTVELSVDSFDDNLCGGYVGIVVRNNDKADSANITLRVSNTGRICLASRKNEGEQTSCDSSIEHKGPWFIKLVKTGDKYQAYSKKEDKWISLGHITMTFENGEPLMGVGLFSLNNKLSCEVKLNNFKLS